jgi:phenylpropionate dioxygenase-like ring-hydroxylating dioxygenase large terminal subunit
MSIAAQKASAEPLHKSWVLAGATEEVAKNNDYLSFTVAGLPVVIRRMKDKLVAFRNICSHRHSVIHTEGCGNAMFKCPFHGWTYDADGVPVGVPDNKSSFGFDAEDKKKLALDPVEVDQCGRFLFVRVTPGGTSLQDWLGPLAQQIEHSGSILEVRALLDKEINKNDDQHAI